MKTYTADVQLNGRQQPLNIDAPSLKSLKRTAIQVSRELLDAKKGDKIVLYNVSKYVEEEKKLKRITLIY